MTRTVIEPGFCSCSGSVIAVGANATNSIQAAAPISVPGRFAINPTAFFNQSMPANGAALRVVMSLAPFG